MAKGDIIQAVNPSPSGNPQPFSFAGAPQLGELLLAAAYVQDGTETVTVDGFTEVADSADAGAEWPRVQLFAKIATGSETNSYEATNSGGNWPAVVAYRIEGSFASLAELAGYSANSGEATTLDIPASAATITGNSLVVAAAGAYSEPAVSFNNSFADAINTAGLYSARRTYSSGTAQTTASWTGGDSSSGVMAVISLGSAAAVLSTPTPSGTLGTQTTSTLGATTNQTTGTLYGVVTTASLTGVTASQVKAGQNASGSTSGVSSGNSSVSTTTPSIGITGLTAGTAYNYAEVQNNANGDSNVVIGSFTTASASLTTSLTIVDATGANVASASLSWWLRQGDVIVANGTTSTNGSGLLSLSVPTASAGAATLYYQNAGNTLSGERVVTVA